MTDPFRFQAVREKQLDRQTRAALVEQEKKDRDSSVTFQLASQIVNTVEPEKTIEALERLGEVRLRQIVEWLQLLAQSQINARRTQH